MRKKKKYVLLGAEAAETADATTGMAMLKTRGTTIMTHEMLHVSIGSGVGVDTIVIEMALDECYEGQHRIISTNQLKVSSSLVDGLISFFDAIHFNIIHEYCYNF